MAHAARPRQRTNGEGLRLRGHRAVGYTLFALALALAIGVVLRRAAAAIGITLVAFVAFRLGIEGSVRANYLSPVHRASTGSAEPNLNGAWVMSQMRELRVPGGGHADPATVGSCFNGPKLLDSACLARHGIVEYATAVYQPASRFWLFQGIEQASSSPWRSPSVRSRSSGSRRRVV